MYNQSINYILGSRDSQRCRTKGPINSKSRGVGGAARGSHLGGGTNQKQGAAILGVVEGPIGEKCHGYQQILLGWQIRLVDLFTL